MAFKLSKIFNKKLFRKPYFIVFFLLILGYIGFMFYKNMEYFTNTSFVNNSRKQLILFYSPDCGYCKQVLPIWNKFELDFNGKHNTQITKINGYSYPDLAKQYKIEGFPTILFIKDGSIVSKYSGDRTYNSLVEFLNQLQ